MKAMRLASLPSVELLLQDSRVAPAIAAHGRARVTDELRAMLNDERTAIRSGAVGVASNAARVDTLLARLEAATRPSMMRVFNLTGTVLHTNLGRALLPPEAAAAAAAAMSQACNLEYDLEAGERGERDEHVEAALCRLTGAEAATVVNNNAAAVFLVLHALAHGREVPVSRGELIEIGGAFRMPEIMQSAGCRLREVGTTNRTHLEDFAAAIGDQTAALMKVHTSNYAVVGFSAAVPEGELAALAHAHGLPFVVDLGSGTLVDLQRYGLPAEATPMASLRAGADLVLFSGDKLLGGPQAGIIVGRKELVERLRHSPVKRALRLGKGSIAALAAVLRLYDHPDTLPQTLPTLRLLTRPAEEIRAIAERVLPAVRRFFGEEASVEIADCQSQIGSGSLPVDRLPSAALQVVPAAGAKRTGSALEALARKLRELPIPVIGRVHAGMLWLDLRCLEDEAAFLEQLR
ncbi:MAG: L-seryl-tRNA(Sec) selenium transferase [Betaproteobacteria bacterium]|nr:L-seryl-tRNA(Sec) selenium transferase [Betaproteobacteria bacterium]